MAVADSMHTEGPWTLDSGEALYIRAPDGGAVALGSWLKGKHGALGRRPAAEVHANARLIAAAPDLLAALRELLDAGDYSVNCPDGAEVPAMMRFGKAHEDARAAIAKAEGK